MKTSEFLAKSFLLLNGGRNWVKETFVTNKAGKPISLSELLLHPDTEVGAFCSIGTMFYVDGKEGTRLYGKGLDYLRKYTDKFTTAVSPSNYNDHPETEFKHVEQMFNWSIEDARKRGD
jgi:hypothetical protein